MASEGKRSSPVEFVKIILGLDKQKAAHLGRRAWLAIWLQIMASWTGITAVTAYSPVLLRQAGYSSITQNGLAGGVNTIGIVGTIISAQVVDRYGRRTCLMVGSAGLFAVNVIVSRRTVAKQSAVILSIRANRLHRCSKPAVIDHPRPPILHLRQ